uniref:Chromatin modification-related protein MEAF6 n=1 Tax=Angiostrongylus cantonensis TaxID=6313 RepID=A0A0K0DLL3_ANGCA
MNFEKCEQETFQKRLEDLLKRREELTRSVKTLEEEIHRYEESFIVRTAELGNLAAGLKQAPWLKFALSTPIAHTSSEFTANEARNDDGVFSNSFGDSPVMRLNELPKSTTLSDQPSAPSRVTEVAKEDVERSSSKDGKYNTFEKNVLKKACKSEIVNETLERSVLETVSKDGLEESIKEEKMVKAIRKCMDAKFSKVADKNPSKENFKRNASKENVLKNTSKKNGVKKISKENMNNSNAVEKNVVKNVAKKSMNKVATEEIVIISCSDESANEATEDSEMVKDRKTFRESQNRRVKKMNESSKRGKMFKEAFENSWRSDAKVEKVGNHWLSFLNKHY